MLMNDLPAILPRQSYSPAQRRLLSATQSSLLETQRSLQAAMRELQGRERAKQSLLTFASAIEIPGTAGHVDDAGRDVFSPVEAAFGKHHLLWLDCLQKVQDGKIKRLMGLMPPGSAKSTYTSVVFPVHTLARFPKTQIIVANYASDLPRRWGRRARSIIHQKNFQRIFGLQLSSESSAADEWALENGSEYMGVGLLAGITGNRADGVIWDDLIKGREHADSEMLRQKTWEAYNDDLLTRKKPNAFEIGITTRWHEDDVAGRILPESYNGQSGFINCRDGHQWYVVCIPAEAEREDDILGRAIGERIWPEWFPPDHFTPFKRYPRTWSALYQQRPSPAEGDYFKREWLRPCNALPPLKTLNVYGGSDYAVTANGGDYTVHIVVGIDPEWRMYLLDVWRAQTSSDKWVDAFCDLVLKWKPRFWAEERGQITAGVGPFLDKRQRERGARVYREGFPARGVKAIRAQAIRARIAQDGLYYPPGAPWWIDFQDELLHFPAGRHDDQVDALGLIGQLLDKMFVYPSPQAEEKRWRDRWDKAFAKDQRDGVNWKTV
jgi:predicted phage terminase large subunit-like protein